MAALALRAGRPDLRLADRPDRGCAVGVGRWISLGAPRVDLLARPLTRLAAEVGVCTLATWESYSEAGGEPAGWMAEVRGDRVAEVAARLG